MNPARAALLIGLMLGGHLFLPPIAGASELQYQVKLTNTSGANLADVPVTFAHPFRRDDIPAGSTLQVGVIGASVPVTYQVDDKATYDDGSLRHAVISLVVPSIGPAQAISLELTATTSSSNQPPVTLENLVEAGQTFEVDLTIGEQTYRARLADAIATPIRMWLEGPVASEWITDVPFRRLSDEEPHSDLKARFYVRKYSGTNNVKVDLVVENLTTFNGVRQRFDYAAEVRANGKVVYRKDDITHFTNTRWKYTFWTQGEPGIHVSFDPAALMATRAIPSYDPRLIGDLANQPSYSGYTGSEYVDHRGLLIDRYGPMGRGGLSQANMSATGQRGEIGPLPNWTVNWILTQTPASKFAMIRNSDLAGSWSIHYRDENTGYAVTIDEKFGGYPRWGVGPGSLNPGPVQSVEDSSSPMSPDDAHQPQFSFVPYLVTGDYFHFEELEFWAAYNLARQNPGAVVECCTSSDGYRNRHKGYITNRGQVRSRAWNLRTLAMTAAFTPDKYYTKAYWEQILANNIERFHGKFAGANDYGYGKLSGGSSPWQDDYLTWAIGYTLSLGYESIRPTAEWKTLFPVARMGKGVLNSAWCWQAAADYSFGSLPEPIYPTVNAWWEAWQPAAASLTCGTEAMADALQLNGPGHMTGRPHSNDSYVAQFGPALAAAVDVGAEGSREAWDIYIGVTGQREVYPDYRGSARYAIVPSSYQPIELARKPKPPKLTAQ